MPFSKIKKVRSLEDIGICPQPMPQGACLLRDVNIPGVPGAEFSCSEKWQHSAGQFFPIGLPFDSSLFTLDGYNKDVSFIRNADYARVCRTAGETGGVYALFALKKGAAAKAPAAQGQVAAIGAEATFGTCAPGPDQATLPFLLTADAAQYLASKFPSPDDGCSTAGPNGEIYYRFTTDVQHLEQAIADVSNDINMNRLPQGVTVSEAQGMLSALEEIKPETEWVTDEGKAIGPYLFSTDGLVSMGIAVLISASAAASVTGYLVGRSFRKRTAQEKKGPPPLPASAEPARSLPPKVQPQPELQLPLQPPPSLPVNDGDLLRQTVEEADFPDIDLSECVAEDGALERYGRDLNAEFNEGNLEPLNMGLRSEVIAQVRSIFVSGRNLILTGEHGVGKASIVDGLAQGIEMGLYPDLKDASVIVLDTEAIMEDAAMDPQLTAARLEAFFTEAAAMRSGGRQAIVFIDHLQILTRPETAGVLSKVLADGEVTVIGAVTEEAYKANVVPFIVSHGELADRFGKIHIDPMTSAQSVEALKARLKNMGGECGPYPEMMISEEALMEAVYLADQYISDEELPGKAGRLLAEAIEYRREQSMEDPSHAARLSYIDVHEYFEQRYQMNVPNFDEYEGIVRSVESDAPQTEIVMLLGQNRSISPFDKPTVEIPSQDVQKTMALKFDAQTVTAIREQLSQSQWFNDLFPHRQMDIIDAIIAMTHEKSFSAEYVTAGKISAAGLSKILADMGINAEPSASVYIEGPAKPEGANKKTDGNASEKDKEAKAKIAGK